MKKQSSVGVQESIVLIGGGNGVYQIARFLKYIRPNITTIQTIFDSGGHSGVLRDERGVLPPGDIRRAILALSDDSMESELRDLLAFRFRPMNGSSLDDVTVGNILLTALAEVTGSMPQAISVLCRWFGVRGKVLPISLDQAHVCAKLSDGAIIKGEGTIDKRSIKDKRKILSVFLEPKAHIYTVAYDAIVKADKIVFCPGDFYSSVVPNTLVEGFRDAIRESAAKIILVTNVMTKKVETDGFSVSRFAKILLQYIGRKKFDAVICNSGKIKKETLERYAKEGAMPVKVDSASLKKFTRQIIAEDVADESGGVVRHSEKAAKLIADV